MILWKSIKLHSLGQSQLLISLSLLHILTTKTCHNNRMFTCGFLLFAKDRRWTLWRQGGWLTRFWYPWHLLWWLGYNKAVNLTSGALAWRTRTGRLEVDGTGGTGREGAEIVGNGEDVVCNEGARLGNGEERTNKQMNEPTNAHTNALMNEWINNYCQAQFQFSCS